MEHPEPLSEPLWPWEGQFYGVEIGDVPKAEIMRKLGERISVAWRERLEDEKRYRSGRARGTQGT